MSSACLTSWAEKMIWHAIVTMDPSPKTRELHATKFNEIRCSRECCDYRAFLAVSGSNFVICCGKLNRPFTGYGYDPRTWCHTPTSTALSLGVSWQAWCGGILKGRVFTWVLYACSALQLEWKLNFIPRDFLFGIGHIGGGGVILVFLVLQALVGQTKWRASLIRQDPSR